MDSTEIEGDILLTAIYQTVADGAGWPDALAVLQQQLGAKAAFLTSTDLQRPVNNFHHAAGMPDSWHAERDATLASHGYSTLAREWFSRLPVGLPMDSDHRFGNAEAFIHTGGDFAETLAHHGIRHLLVVILERGDFQTSVLALGGDRPFPPDRALRLRPIARVLQHALALRKQVSIARTDNERIYGMLDALNDGIMLLDKSALVRYVNPKAIALLKRQESVSILHGVFSMLRPERNQAMQLQLREAMSASLHPTANSRNRVIILETHSEKDKLLLTLTPLRRLTPFRALLADGVAAIVFIRNPGRRYHVCEKMLHDAYHLSPREADICQRFVNTTDLETLSTETGLAMHSLRSVFRNIYEKTGSHSQADLIRLLIGLRSDVEDSA